MGNLLSDQHPTTEGQAEEELHAIVAALQSNTSLTHLDLRYNKIGKEGCVALAAALQFNTSLTQLNLAWGSIRDAGCEAIGAVLQTNNSLTHLDMRYNRLGRKGGLAIGAALRSNSSLTHLNLAWNRIEDEGCVAIADALPSNTSLTQLNLGWNGIAEEGCVALGDALRFNTSLAHLNLRGNRISKEGCVAMGAALYSNTSLTHLNLDGNDIGKEGCFALGISLQSNTSLTYLNLRGPHSYKERGREEIFIIMNIFQRIPWLRVEVSWKLKDDGMSREQLTEEKIQEVTKEELNIHDQPIWGDKDSVEMFDNEYARLLATYEGTIPEKDDVPDSQVALDEDETKTSQSWERIPAEEFANIPSGTPVLGAGGYATVYRMNWKGQETAVKVIRLISSTSEEQKEKMLREIDVMNSLHSSTVVSHFPNLLGITRADFYYQMTLLGACIDDPHQITIVMPLMNGGSIADLLKTRTERDKKMLSMGKVMDIGRAILRGLCYLHSKNIVHRDIKVDNILIHHNKEGKMEIKLADFSVSRIIEEEKMTGATGSLKTMAPEVVAAEDLTTATYDCRVDIFSFSIVLYEILFCQYPFPGNNQVQFALLILKGQKLLFPPDRRGTVWEGKDERDWPMELEALIVKCYSMKPENRPTAEEALDTLNKIRERQHL